jgi:hypothetical protein
VLIARAVAVVVLGALATYATEYMGFAIVHSAGGLAIVALLAPGFYVALFNVVPNDWGTYLAMFLVNSGYYWAIAGFLKRKAKS